MVCLMLFGSLNCVAVLQRKLPFHCLSPHICPLCLKEELQHLFFECSYASKCWHWLFGFFNVCWVFGGEFSSNLLQIVVGPALKKKPQLLWSNAVKALLSKLWFERNQQVFHDKASSWLDHFEFARLNASSWCTLSRAFDEYSIQEFNLNWHAFISPHHQSNSSTYYLHYFCLATFVIKQDFGLQFWIVLLPFVSAFFYQGDDEVLWGCQPS